MTSSRIKSILRQTYSSFKEKARNKAIEKDLNTYLKNERKPWSTGYSYFKENLIREAINSKATLQKFAEGISLEANYGEFIDERVVEYPWLISRLSSTKGKLFDAGSILNFDYVINHGSISNKDVTIATLEPEGSCFWQNRISYVFCDLRHLPFRDNWFDEVISLSTIEHIGMNNSIYSSDPNFVENEPWSFLEAVTELKRVVKVGGKVYISVPYGEYTNFGWYQQFNAEMINKLIETFAPSKIKETYFCYENSGWNFSDKDSCANIKGFNIHDTKYFNPNSTKDYDTDFAACSRGIAALEMWK
jgi:SAM-dependent methyltransferase